MKKIEAIIRSEKYEATKEALAKAGVHGITVTVAMGCGRQKGRVDLHAGREESLSLLPKTKLEIIADDGQVEDILRVIETAAKTGEAGDGKIFVQPVENAVRIRTGERGSDAV